MGNRPSVLPTLIVLCGFCVIAAVRADEPREPQPKAPVFLMEGRRRLVFGSDEIRAHVRVEPHQQLRTVRLEMWELREVEPERTLAHLPSEDFPADILPLIGLWEPNGSHPVRASEEPVTHGWNQAVYLFTLRGPFASGRYRLLAVSVLNTLVRLKSAPFDFQIG